MPVVLIDPPAVAQPDAQIAEHQAQDVADPLEPGDLIVTSVVAQEANLGEYHGEEHGHGKLPPRVTHHDEGGPADSQQKDGRGDPPGVTPWSPFHQARLPDLTR